MLVKLAALHLSAEGSPRAPTENFVAAVFYDLLNRAPDSGGLAYWTSQLGGGAPRGEVAQQLTHSDEYFATIIDPAYQQFLGREPDASGLQFWTAQMRTGLTDERLEAGFIGSREFFDHSGGTNKSWVDAMYQALLGRAADAQGEAYWVAQVDQGANRSDVAYGFAASLEREGQRVSNDYLTYLGRLPDATGLGFWVSQFAGGLTNEDLIAGFVASNEYFDENT
ncbi:MAG TPA: DUF4214 domain-containing protein [Pirellulales bacterium]|nr:DUF4214 domain-containing protein [Pirellulales bacterium]